MRNFLKILAVAVAAAVAFSAPLTPVSAQALPFTVPARSYIADLNITLDNTPIFAIKYVGTGNAATVAVEADSNLTFVVNGVAYNGFECPVAGPTLDGVIDVSDGACNSAGEIVDVINNDVNHLFKAVILTGTRAEVVTAATALLADAADNDVTRPEGEIVYREQAGVDDSYVPFWGNNVATQGILPWLPVGATELNPNPFRNTDTVLLYGHFNVTNAGVITNIEAHCTVENYNSRGNSSEVDTVVFLKAGAATGVTALINEFLYGGLHCQGGKFWFYEEASGADTTANTLLVNGYQEKIAR